jgi:predicted secreted Zn-dependent protease
MTSTPIVAHLPSFTATGAVDIPHAVLTYYDISGSTANELRAELDAKGPVGYDGYKGDSTTKWSFSWDWPGYGNTACNLSAATVRYDIEVIFPRWTPPRNAAPDLVARWNDYIRRLAEHEMGHVDFVVANYQTVADAVKGATCLTAEIAGQAALMPIRQHDLDYDATTQHGATQGARFP